MLIIKKLMIKQLMIREYQERCEEVKTEEKEAFKTPREVTHNLIITSQIHRRVIEQCLKETGIHRAQHRLLMSLACSCFSSQVDLAKKLEVTPATIAVSLKTLERDGLVTRTVGEKDNRTNFIELTEKGKKLVEDSKDYFDSVDHAMYTGFTGEEMVTLCSFLERIYDNMNRIAEKHTKTT